MNRLSPQTHRALSLRTIVSSPLNIRAFLENREKLFYEERSDKKSC